LVGLKEKVEREIERERLEVVLRTSMILKTVGVGRARRVDADTTAP
jgi:hypothetical protein